MFILKFYENEAEAKLREENWIFFHLHLQHLLSRQTCCALQMFFLFEECVRAKFHSTSLIYGTLLVRIFLEFYGEFRKSDNNNSDRQHGASFGEKMIISSR